MLLPNTNGKESEKTVDKKKVKATEFVSVSEWTMKDGLIFGNETKAWLNVVALCKVFNVSERSGHRKVIFEIWTTIAM